MRLYHHSPHCEAILREGFHDRRGYWLVGHLFWQGVWVENAPGRGPDGRDWRVIAVDLPEELAARYELTELDKRLPFREFLVPADVLNRAGAPQLVPGMTAPSRDGRAW